MNRFKGYFYALAGGVVLLAAGVFLALQWGSKSNFSAYGPQVTCPTFWLIVFSGIGGVVAYWMGRVTLQGLRLIRRAQRDEAGKAGPKDA